jgi:hypothetical protein
VRGVEFAPEVRLRFVAADAPEFCLTFADEKKCCELVDAFLTEEAPGALFVELKLSRDGAIGSLPVNLLACRNDAALTLPWRPETASRPNLFPSIAEMPERTRWFLSTSLRFEYWCTRPFWSGPHPS